MSADLQLGFGFTTELPAGIGNMTAEYRHTSRSGNELDKKTKTYLTLEKCGEIHERD
jgi:hypothetical protein